MDRGVRNFSLSLRASRTPERQHQNNNTGYVKGPDEPWCYHSFVSTTTAAPTTTTTAAPTTTTTQAPATTTTVAPSPTTTQAPTAATTVTPSTVTTQAPTNTQAPTATTTVVPSTATTQAPAPSPTTTAAQTTTTTTTLIEVRKILEVTVAVNDCDDEDEMDAFVSVLRATTASTIGYVIFECCCSSFRHDAIDRHDTHL